MSSPLRASSETIVAPITAIGGAVAVVRLSGPDALSVAHAMFAGLPHEIKPRVAYYGQVAGLDSGLFTYFAGPASYTGEDSVELSVHGSGAAVRAVVERACELGARLALPGEFTQRAFIHGKLDLTQAEGVKATVEAESLAQLRLAGSLRNGALFERIGALRTELDSLRAEIDARTDFSEEIGELDSEIARPRLVKVFKELNALAARAVDSAATMAGHSVALVGRPNAGKSSLLNALLQRDRAIVSSIPGTTRDTLEEAANLAGIRVRFIDTAGLRTSDDPIEQAGIERAKHAASHADLMIFLLDSQFGWTEGDHQIVEELDPERLICVATKTDLGPAPVGLLPVCALNGEGLAELIGEIEGRLADNSPLPLVLPRHQSELVAAAKLVQQAIHGLDADIPNDLLHTLLTEARTHLGFIIGEDVDPAGLERIFADFCIGK